MKHKDNMPFPTEHQEQAALFRWWRIMAKGETRDLLFAIPNGGARDPITGRILKDEGVKAGVPDIFLALPRNKFHGLWLEMKRQNGGKLSDAQKLMLRLLAKAGYATAVCRGMEEAARSIRRYMGWHENPAIVDVPNSPQPWRNWGDNDDEE